MRISTVEKQLEQMRERRMTCFGHDARGCARHCAAAPRSTTSSSGCSRPRSQERVESLLREAREAEDAAAQAASTKPRSCSTERDGPRHGRSPGIGAHPRLSWREHWQPIRDRQRHSGRPPDRSCSLAEQNVVVSPGRRRFRSRGHRRRATRAQCVGLAFRAGHDPTSMQIERSARPEVHSTHDAVPRD